MKRLLLLLALVAATASAEPVIIPTAKTVSSIPLLALEGRTIGGLTLSTPFFDDHPLAVGELIGGKTQLLQTGTSLAIKNSQSGGPLVHIATAVWDVSGLVTLDPAAKSLEDFVGKSVILPLAGGPLDLQFQTLLKAKGLVGKVKVDYAEPPQAVALLLAHKVDAAALPEPLVSRVVLLNQGNEVFTFAQAWAGLNNGDGRAPALSVVARRDWAAAHPDFLKAFRQALRESVAAVLADPKAAAAQYASALGLPPAVVERGLAHSLFALPGDDETKALFASYLKLVGETKPVAADFFVAETH